MIVWEMPNQKVVAGCSPSAPMAQIYGCDLRGDWVERAKLAAYLGSSATMPCALPLSGNNLGSTQVGLGRAESNFGQTGGRDRAAAAA
jgi:hypothetical protein